MTSSQKLSPQGEATHNTTDIFVDLADFIMYFYYGSQDEIVKRRDLRDITICSVDPPSCTDIDDALHCKPLPNGNFEVHTIDFTTVIEY